MKKKILAAALVAPFLLTSCLGDPKDTKVTQSYMMRNVVISSDPNEEPVLGEGEYKFVFNVSQQTVEMSGSSIKVGNQTGSFASPVGSYTGTSFYNRITFPSCGNFAGDPSMPVTHLTCNIYNVYYIAPEDVTVPDIPVLKNFSPLPLMIYNVGSYQVKTFYPYPVFGGTTLTRDNTGTEFKTTDMSYQIVMKVDKSKADVVLYKAKFSDKMPSSIPAIVLKDLDLKFTRTGYTVSGTDIIPMTLDGNKLTPFESFPFNNFTLTTTSEDMTSASITYRVKGFYEGMFNGKSVITETPKN